MPTTEKKYPPLRLESKIKFGKYKDANKTLLDLINEDLKYVGYLINNKIIQVDPVAYGEYRDRLKQNISKYKPSQNTIYRRHFKR